MSEHLPECPRSQERGKTYTFADGCQCVRLRACEERVRDRYRESKVYGPEIRFEDGFNDCKDRAIEAVKGVQPWTVDAYLVWRDDVFKVLRDLRVEET